MLRVKQSGIKYHFLSSWYDSTGDWTPVSRAIGEHSIHYANKGDKKEEKLTFTIWKISVSIFL